MKSMTGYGRGECAQDGFKVTVELSSVNRKQSEISVLLPRELEVLEAQIRDVINRFVARGRVTARVSLHSADGRMSGRVRLNAGLAKAYVRELHRLAKDLKLEGPVTLDMLARAPGVFQTDEEMADAEDFWPVVEKSLQQAIATLLKMREREGTHLAKDLQKRIAVVRKSVERVQKQAPEVVKRFQEQLRERIKNAGLEMPDVEDERLLKEIVYFADRSDISEELTRLQSHFQQFDDCVKSGEPVGRTLDFLAQEMNREINTIGSKANDAMISREVVVLEEAHDYFDETATVANATTHTWVHPLGDIISGLLRAGMSLDWLHEHDGEAEKERRPRRADAFPGEENSGTGADRPVREEGRCLLRSDQQPAEDFSHLQFRRREDIC